jgi:hypothetical protein
MQKVFIVATIITVLFGLAKIVEMKYIEKEWKPLKFLVRDIIIVFACSVIGSFSLLKMDGSITDFLNIVTDNKSFNMSATQIFTDEPAF